MVKKYFIVFFIIIIILAASFLLRRSYDMMKDSTAFGGRWFEVEALALAMPPSLKEAFKPGDILRDKYGSEDGKILAVLEREFKNRSIIDPVFFEKNPGYKNSAIASMRLKLLCFYDRKEKTFLYKKRRLQTGALLPLWTDKYRTYFFARKITEA